VAHDDDAAGALSAAIDLRDRVKGDPALADRIAIRTKAALDLDDDRYPYSWLPPDDAHVEASELAERGPEAFPD
jgi:hypothetical protein